MITFIPFRGESTSKRNRQVRQLENSFISYQHNYYSPIQLLGCQYRKRPNWF